MVMHNTRCAALCISAKLPQRGLQQAEWANQTAREHAHLGQHVAWVGTGRGQLLGGPHPPWACTETLLKL